jgi:8-oxo-dGTP pyrophosphatase MutT (NUDIX family)
VDALKNERFDYDAQLKWEHEARKMSDRIVYWLNRDVDAKRLGLTSNTEFGIDFTTDPGRVRYGHPSDAEHVSYTDDLLMKDVANGFIQNKYQTVYSDMKEMLSSVVNEFKEIEKRSAFPIRRNDGEVNVPLDVWTLPFFQSWLASQKQNGNRLDDARILNVQRVSNGKVFSFSMWVKVWISAEQRYKENEFILGRPDVSTILGYHGDEILLVREFRSPANNDISYIDELPGGSSFKLTSYTPDRLKTNAVHEFREETGVDIDPANVEFVVSKQLMSTLSVHRSHLYKVKLTDLQWAKIKEDIDANKTFGVAEDTEMTYLKIIKSKDVFKEPGIDFSMIGMICTALQK